MEIPALNKGYVRLRDTMGGDYKPADVARVSFDKKASDFSEERNEKLINYLFKNKEYSCVRHNVMSFEIYMPLMVARQIYKYSIASSFREDQYGWNESCLPARQEINLWDGNTVTVEDLLKNPSNFTLKSAADNGRIIPNKIKSVWSVGDMKVYKVTDTDGRTVELTGNHRVLTDNGYVEVDDLSIGDKIAHNGTALYKDKSWLEEHYRTKDMYLEEVAALAGCSTHTIRKWAKRFNLQKPRTYSMQKYNKENGVFGKGLTSETSEVIKERSRKSKEWHDTVGYQPPRGEDSHAWKGDSVDGDHSTYHYRARRLMEGHTECIFCGQERDEIHHLDWNHKNNNLNNLAPVCTKCHHDIHNADQKMISYSSIASIEYVETIECFDIEMEKVPNFVAGGLVVHNSRRYITETPEFYIPEHNQWRTSPENKKQGSGKPLPNDKGKEFTESLMKHIDNSMELYDKAIESDIAVEQARVFLPAYGMYVRAYWTASLNSLFHFLDERLATGAQSEIRDYAEAVRDIIEDTYPIIYYAWKDNQ